MAGRSIRLLFCLLAIATLAAACATGVPASREVADRTPSAGVAGSGSGAQPRIPPNIVLILTDDQRADELWPMPTVRRSLIQEGVTFSNAYVTTPSCCPSRSSILTGLYSHNTGVWKNSPPHGGASAFDPTPTIATRLHSVGYRTALIGKYLNGYNGDGVPPGWDRWMAFATGDVSVHYRHYRLNVDGRIKEYGGRPSDYSMHVFTKAAVSFIHSSSEPYFLYLALPAPHTPATPSKRYHRSFSAGLDAHRPPSFNEANVSDKPPWVRGLHLIGNAGLAAIDERQANQLRTLLSVDDTVGRVTRALEATGAMDHTLLVYMSDNGLMWGEHRLSAKYVPYEESIRIPMVVRYDGVVDPGSTDDRLVLNEDIAPTFAAAAGISMPNVDGRSLLPLLARQPIQWRTDFPIEHLGPPTPSYCGVHTQRWVFVRYDHGGEELYDLRRDPYQLSNLAGSSRARDEMRALRARAFHLCRPLPPGMEFPR